LPSSLPSADVDEGTDKSDFPKSDFPKASSKASGDNGEENHNANDYWSNRDDDRGDACTL
jgi:hypothetical protein